MGAEHTGQNDGSPATPAAAETAAVSSAEPERPAADLEAARQDAELWRRKSEENLDLAMRARAELENLRKRTVRDVESAHKYALERFVNELLPVLDSMELGLAASAAGDVVSLRQGLELTLKLFADALQKFGVTVLDPMGEKFNPERHHAVSVQEAVGVEPGTVIAVMQKGYELNGRLVRPAVVAVAR
ncbi:MAG: nucleotide exchange factor GrpE [Gammaproteobacteria bacterium]|nr:nucleotide exchange factor GrpE [Gammaproteobacteria bacterium]